MLKIRFVAALFLVLLLLHARAQDQPGDALDSLRRRDNLEEWLYLRMEYTDADPQKRLPFLMATSSAVWRKPATGDERLAWMLVLSNQGYYQLQAGNILASIDRYEAAYTFSRSFTSSDFDLVEYVLKPLSNNYTRLGDYERAVFIQQQSINRLQKTHSPDEIASVYNNLAISYLSMGNAAAADSAIAAGLRIAGSPRVKFRLRTVFAETRLDAGEAHTAEVILQQNLAQAPGPVAENAYWLAGAYAVMGRACLEQDKTLKAAAYFQKALSLLDDYHADERVRERANLVAQLGKTNRRLHRYKEALAAFDRALRLLRIDTGNGRIEGGKLYGENKLMEIFQERALVWQALGDRERSLDNFRYALLVSEKMRNEFADDKTRERLQAETRDLAEAAIEAAYTCYQEKKDDRYAALILEIAEQTKARTLYDQVQRNLQLARGSKDPLLKKIIRLRQAIAYNERAGITEGHAERYQGRVSALKFELALLEKSARVTPVNNSMPAKTILRAVPDLHAVEFFFGKRSLYAISIAKGRIASVTRQAGADLLREELLRFVETWFRKGPANMTADPKAFYMASQSLYTRLLGHLRLGKDGAVCIIPDDVLGYLSFESLITRGSYSPGIAAWPFLIREVSITYAYSLGSLSRKTVPSPGGFSGLFITHEGRNSLPAVKKEAEAIQAEVDGHFLFDGQVNKRTFFEAFERSNVLHIGTHAYLAGASRQPVLDLGAEKLYLFELLARKKAPALVVLSACRTNDGLLAQGEGVISLARGFAAIGAGASVAGLWNVNDDAAAGITAVFYQKLKEGKTCGEALRLAKLNWLESNKGSDAEYLPYFWDSLVLMGENEPARFSGQGNYIGLLVALALSGLAGLLVLRRFRQHRVAG